MKRILILAFLAIGVLCLGACGPTYKACGAYAKHDVPEQPSLSDVQ